MIARHGRQQCQRSDTAQKEELSEDKLEEII